MAEVEIVFWYWWVLAAVLLVAELLSPGFFFLWMAISGFVTGCVLLLIPAISIETQVLVFSILSIVSIWVWRIYAKKNPIETDKPFLNKRGAQYIGRVFTLIEPIENGYGKIKVGDTVWKVQGEGCVDSKKVRVVGVDGVVLKVEQAE